MVYSVWEMYIIFLAIYLKGYSCLKLYLYALKQKRFLRWQYLGWYIQYNNISDKLAESNENLNDHIISVSWKCQNKSINVRLSISHTESEFGRLAGVSKYADLKVKLATVVEGDPKAPFSIATTPRCRGERYSFPRIAPVYPYYVPYEAES